MLKTKSFKDANVFMSRNLVTPEIFDALHDALKQNGAEVFLCSDPSRNGPNEFHVISSPEHEKFESLRAKGCNLLGPQCVLSCAKENRALPKRGFTCCLAMDGVKVLVSGFDMSERVEIAKKVEAMSGVLLTKATLDVSFVIAKNVQAAKYKWALNTLKKPIVTIDWLQQCWNEHRVVPQEAYRVSPFSGLTICVSKIPAVERKEMEKLIVQNGGKYSADLTKKCTHLICEAPEGDKYKVARRWGNIHIINRKWFDQSIARRACLNEELYPPVDVARTSTKSASDYLTQQRSQELVPSSVAADSDLPDVPFAWTADPDLETTLSQGRSYPFSEAKTSTKDGHSEACAELPKNENNLDTAVANDSQSEENDLYLSECRILLVGFEASELRKMVRMVRRGGGSRYMLFNDRLTHIVVGNPSEVEKKEIRSLAALGVIYVVRTTWLEDCDREKKELPVLQSHIAYDALISKDSLRFTKAATGISSMVQAKKSTVNVNVPSDPQGEAVNSEVGMNLETVKNKNCVDNVNAEYLLTAASKLPQHCLVSAQHDITMHGKKVQLECGVQSGKSSSVFKGKRFCFSSSFPEDRRAEIIQWVNQGGGEVVRDYMEQNVHFTIECHGVKPSSSNGLQTIVSSHWIRSCLEDGFLLDVGSHILYSPLPCQIPLPDFRSFRFCVSQYEDKDRLLLRNLCFVVGAKFVERLTKKVTHLLCKFKGGQKYEAACKWGIHSVTSEWIYECVRQNKVVPLALFSPKEATAQDQDAGLCTVSQFPTQAFKMISGDNPSQYSSQSQETQRTPAKTDGYRNIISEEKGKELSHAIKRARVSEDNETNAVPSYGEHSSVPCKPKPTAQSMSTDLPRIVPDVAAVIEDLLEQTSKIHDVESPERTGCGESLFSSDSLIIPQNHSDSLSTIGLSKNWMKRTERKYDIDDHSRDVGGGCVYGGFSETQTESQVVGYEEDLSGRQMLIDRVRTRSSLS